MPAPRRTEAEAAQALVAVAPLAARWIERLLAAHEPPLTTPQSLALRAIAREKVSVNELARRAGVSGPAASQLVSALAEAGLLDRRTAEPDRRRQEHALTAKGRRALASAEDLLAGQLASLIGGLPRPEIDALARALPQVEAALSGTAPPRRPPSRPPHLPHDRPRHPRP
jgi:DNA-binding MarR family transcriptional regulator